MNQGCNAELFIYDYFMIYLYVIFGLTNKKTKKSY